MGHQTKICIGTKHTEGCGIEKPLKEFRKRIRKKGVVYSGQCWACAGKNKRARQEAVAMTEGRECRKIVRNRADVLEGLKYCWVCKDTKPVDSFGINSTKFDGRCSECKECVSDMNEARKGFKAYLPLKKDWWIYLNGYYCRKYIEPKECRECGEMFKPLTKASGICGDECKRIKAARKQREYHRNNPWSLRSRKYKRKLRERELDDGTCNGETFKQLYQSRGTCVYCNVTLTMDNTTLDHMDPLSLSGVHGVSNLIPSCKDCNTKKRAKPFSLWVKTLPESERGRVINIYNTKKQMAVSQDTRETKVSGSRLG